MRGGESEEDEVSSVSSVNQLGLCRLQQKKLVAAIEEAWDYGKPSTHSAVHS